MKQNGKWKQYATRVQDGTQRKFILREISQLSETGLNSLGKEGAVGAPGGAVLRILVLVEAV